MNDEEMRGRAEAAAKMKIELDLTPEDVTDIKDRVRLMAISHAAGIADNLHITFADKLLLRAAKAIKEIEDSTHCRSADIDRN